MLWALKVADSNTHILLLNVHLFYKWEGTRVSLFPLEDSSKVVEESSLSECQCW